MHVRVYTAQSISVRDMKVEIAAAREEASLLSPSPCMIISDAHFALASQPTMAGIIKLWYNAATCSQ